MNHAVPTILSCILGLVCGWLYLVALGRVGLWKHFVEKRVASTGAVSWKIMDFLWRVLLAPVSVAVFVFGPFALTASTVRLRPYLLAFFVGCAARLPRLLSDARKHRHSAGGHAGT